MSAPFTEKQVRTALAALVTTASGSTKVYPWNALNFKLDKNGKPDFSEWAGLFRMPSVTHGWVIRRVARETELLSVGCETFTYFYEIYGFYGFNVGNATTNSDDAFSAIVEAVSDAFNLNSLIDVTPSATTYQLNHSGLQFPVLTVIQAGEEMMHFAQGVIELTYST